MQTVQPIQPVYIVTALVSHIKDTLEASPSAKLTFEAGTTFNDQEITNRIIRAVKRRLLLLGNYSIGLSHFGNRNRNIGNYSGAVNVGSRQGVTIGGQEVEDTAILSVSKKILNPSSTQRPLQPEKNEIPEGSNAEFIKYILDERAEDLYAVLKYKSGETYGKFFIPTKDDLQACKMYFKSLDYLALLSPCEDDVEKFELKLLKSGNR